MHFPTWRYHRTKPPALVENIEQLEELGAGWADNPGVFESKDSPLFVAGSVTAEAQAEAHVEQVAFKPIKKGSKK